MHVIFKISCTHLVDLTYVIESLKNIDVKIFCLFIAEVLPQVLDVDQMCTRDFKNYIHL